MKERLTDGTALLRSVPITELPCPQCGSEVKMGLPRGATVKSVTAAERAEPAAPRRKMRSLVCHNDHELHVVFEW